VASGEPYTNLHLTSDREPRQHPSTRLGGFLQAGWSSCHPTNSIKAL